MRPEFFHRVAASTTAQDSPDTIFQVLAIQEEVYVHVKHIFLRYVFILWNDHCDDIQEF